MNLFHDHASYVDDVIALTGLIAWVVVIVAGLFFALVGAIHVLNDWRASRRSDPPFDQEHLYIAQ